MGTIKADSTEIAVSAPKVIGSNAAITEQLNPQEHSTPDTLVLEDVFLLSSQLNDLEQARYYARMSFKLFDEITNEEAKAERNRIRKELKNLREAIYSISDEAFIDLIHAENVGDFAETQKQMLKQIDAVIRQNLNGPGGNSMIKFHKAASYLLEHFYLVRERPTASVFEKAGGAGLQYSAAVEFLNAEFQRLAHDKIDRRQSAVTIIKAWLKSNPKTRSNTTK